MSNAHTHNLFHLSCSFVCCHGHATPKEIRFFSLFKHVFTWGYNPFLKGEKSLLVRQQNEKKTARKKSEETINKWKTFLKSMLECLKQLKSKN